MAMSFSSKVFNKLASMFSATKDGASNFMNQVWDNKGAIGSAMGKAGLVALLGTLFMPGIGTAIGFAIGSAYAVKDTETVTNFIEKIKPGLGLRAGGGAILGAAIGSFIMPGLGTMIGGVIGAGKASNPVQAANPFANLTPSMESSAIETASDRYIELETFSST